jgi:hypothetical protein
MKTRDAMKKIVGKGGCASHLVKGSLILSVTLDRENRSVSVYMIGTPDMGGGINLARFLMPGVESVMFYDDEGVPDMLYLNGSDGWKANCQRRGRTS